MAALTPQRPGTRTPFAAPALALAAAGAFSALPGAFYHHVAEATGSTWSTVWLFAGHGLAGVVGLSLLSRGARSGAAAPGTGSRLLPRLLLADAIAGLLLVLAPPPGGFALLLAGRLITGFLLGMITPLATGLLLGSRSGSAVAVAAIFGGVGAGSLGAGALSGLGLSRPAVLGTGVLLLLSVTALVTRMLREAGPVAAETPPAADPQAGRRLASTDRQDPETDSATTGIDRRAAGAGFDVAAGVVLAFVANGVLALFTSTLPGVVAAHGSDSTLLAGATAGLVMLAAGGVRLGLGRLSARAVNLTGGLGAGIGICLFATGLSAPHGSVAALLGGGLLLGGAAGLGYEAALRTVGPADVHAGAARRGGTELTAARLARTAAVQRGGQLGLVVPVLLYPLVVR